MQWYEVGAGHMSRERFAAWLGTFGQTGFVGNGASPFSGVLANFLNEQGLAGVLMTRSTYSYDATPTSRATRMLPGWALAFNDALVAQASAYTTAGQASAVLVSIA